MTGSSDKEIDFDPHRRLCPDGSCIGVIGDDGTCTVCGTAGPVGDASEPRAEVEPEVEPEVGPEVDPEDDLPGEEGDGHDPADGSSGFDPNRRLCSDEACIGVIGADGRCPVCGKPARP